MQTTESYQPRYLVFDNSGSDASEETYEGDTDEHFFSLIKDKNMDLYIGQSTDSFSTTKPFWKFVYQPPYETLGNNLKDGNYESSFASMVINDVSFYTLAIRSSLSSTLFRLLSLNKLANMEQDDTVEDYLVRVDNEITITFPRSGDSKIQQMIT